MATSSRVPEVIDAIVAALVAADLKTWDGPVVTGDFDNAVWIGFDGDPDGDFQSVVGDQEWAGLGAKRRSETFAIACCATALTGDDSTKEGRDAVYALLDIVQATLRPDPSIGLAPPLVMGVKPSALFTEQTQNGLMVRLVFSINIEIARV